ncbi:homeobox-leucine zipper protein HAT3-like [Apium graveolens]|uniref:homeobox-leucine zipper protein HAT3-like n=1 Tax=Apium graveolens TaxID=4045 RepID=UPI003D79289D
MGERDDGFGLSLSLGSSFSNKQNHAHLPPHFPFALSPSPLRFLNPSDLSGERRMRGIDVNMPAAEGEDDLGASSPNSTVSSLSGKRSENEAERDRDSSYEEEDGGDAAARKKLRLSKEQAAMLEETFKEHNTLNPKQKLALAKELNLRPRQVEVWFQNRRARTKLKQTEVDCEYLKRCCENLTDENKRLQKEVSELRALKLSPQFYMNMNPPTTLTMCPQCERVSSSTNSASASSSLFPPTAIVNERNANNSAGAPQPHRPVPVNPSWAKLFSQNQLEGHRPT